MNIIEYYIISSVYSANAIDLDHAYKLYKDSYLKSTGKAWSKSKFLRRASNWTFFGSENGYIAVRKQYSGFVKIVVVAGKPLAIAKGLKELLSKKWPTWTMATKDLTSSLNMHGMKKPPAILLKIMLPKIMSYGVFGDQNYKILKDGGVKFSTSDVGESVKYFVGSKEYFKKLLKDLATMDINPLVVKAIKKLV